MKLIPEHSIVEQSVEDGLLLLRESGEYIVLNHLAARIWNSLKEGVEMDDLVQGLARLKGAPGEEEVRRAVDQLVNGLKERGYLLEKP